MKKSVKIILHVIFWAFFPIASALYEWSGQFGFMSGFFNNTAKNFFRILIENIQSLFIPPDLGNSMWAASNLFGIIFHIYVFILLPVGIFYLFYGIFIPNMIRNKNQRSKLIPLLFLVLVPFLITSLFSFVTIAVGWEFSHSITITYIIAITFSVLGSFFRISENWIITEKLAKQNLQSELALLKSQINPHFLFNTLNNIDSLIKSNKDKASEMLVKLSGIMRYMIYETNIDKVNLSNEINHIENYIDLQKIQFASTDFVSLSTEGKLNNILIAPMLFIPFVENAFKHCTNKAISNAISIKFSTENNIVNFKCVNVYDAKQPMSKDNASGVGLNLVKRRLNLIYPGKYTLNIKNENNTYQVILSVDTNEH